MKYMRWIACFAILICFAGCAASDIRQIRKAALKDMQLDRAASDECGSADLLGCTSYSAGVWNNRGVMAQNAHSSSVMAFENSEEMVIWRYGDRILATTARIANIALTGAAISNLLKQNDVYDSLDEFYSANADLAGKQVQHVGDPYVVKQYLHGDVDVNHGGGVDHRVSGDVGVHHDGKVHQKHVGTVNHAGAVDHNHSGTVNYMGPGTQMPMPPGD